MSNEQKQKLKDYRKEYYKKYYAEKKVQLCVKASSRNINQPLTGFETAF